MMDAGERANVAWERTVDVGGGRLIRARVVVMPRGDAEYSWSVETLTGTDTDKPVRGERIAGGTSRKRTEAIAAASAALSAALREIRRGQRLGEGVVVLGSPGGPGRDPHAATEGLPDQPAEVRTVEIGVVLEADDATTPRHRR